MGVRWPPVRVESTTEKWRGLEVVVRCRAPLHDGLGPGTPITVEWGAETRNGRVMRVDHTAAILSVDAHGDERWLGETVSVVGRHDPTTWIRYAQALERADGHDSPLKSALLAGTFGAVPETVPAAAPLDPAQARAMAAVLARPPLAVIHGPPGTGKTWLLGHVIAATVAAGERPWALAESNAAVDHLAATLAGRGLDVVRLGHPTRVRDDLQHLTVDARTTKGPLHAALRALGRDLAKLTGHDRATRAQRRTLRRQRTALRQQAWEHAVSSAQVVACTFGTLARVAERLPEATVAFVDEATQATEPAVWTAVPSIDRLVLVGDPEQLGPVVREPGNPLEQSALHRIVQGRSGEDGPPMLEVQHRMNTQVQALVAPTYGPRYRPAPDVADARLTDLPGIRTTPLTERAQLFIDTAGTGAEEARDPVTRSLANEGEARIVIRLVHDLCAAGVQPAQIGVATPYSAQVARLRREPTLRGVEVASINAFQGRERAVMILSWVRSNPEAQVGFVADDRRLTVAWSRARCLLIQVGDSATLSVLPRFAHAQEHLGSDVESGWEPPWSDALGLYD